MTRGMIFKSKNELLQKLPPKHAVVVVKLHDGSLEVYDDPKDITHPYEQHLLACNMAGATVMYGECATTINQQTDLS